MFAAPAAAATTNTHAAATTNPPGTAVTNNPGAATTRTITRPGRTVTITRPGRTVTESSSATPVLISDKNKPPAGYRLTANQVLRIASRDPRTRAELRRHPKAVAYEYTKGPGQWQVSWFSHTKPQTELLQVYITDSDGKVSQAWTGFQVAWSMARGYPGAFGRRINAWFIWVPLCLLFIAPFVPWRRRPTLLHLDLLVLLGFSVSLAFFNHGEIGLSVPLIYPFMIYLLVRLTLLAFGKGVPREPLRTVIPVPWLGVGIIFLVAFRIALNVLNSNVIDVGYSGVIGADKLIHGVALYGHWPKDNMYGDTYGPVSYFVYVPFRAIFGWSGTWDNLPAAHAAAIFFDTLTAVGLFFLGRRVRDIHLGTLLVYGWMAYPFTLYAMNSNTNDSLVAALVVLALLAIGSAPGRGVMAALAGFTKFAPFVLAPLFLRGVGERPRPRSIVAYAVAFAATVVVCMLPVLLKHDLHFFWRDSIQYQAQRSSPFSIWGLWGGLGIEQHLVQGAVVACGIGVYFLPARRTLVQVAALAGALLIALQMTITYWLYPYLVWFFPMVLLALFASHPDDREAVREGWERLQATEGEPIPMRIGTAPS
ncbi:MAG TPA: hypothetical protein VHW04_25010 [Solirubrobacteraceae bacterium]|nr:hypothetical protein [Solirubrobacteraceae bacterium]